VASAGATLSLIGLDKTASRFFSIYDERREYAKACGALVLIVATLLALSIAFVLALIGLRGLLGQSLVSDPLSMTLLITLIALTPVQALDSVMVALLAVFAGAKAIFWRRHVLAPSLQLTAVLLVMFAQGDAQLLALGYVLGGLLGVAIYTLVLLSLLRQRGLLAHFRRDRLQLPAREIFSFSLPMFLSDVAYLVRVPLVVLLLECLNGSVGVAEFRAVFPVARLNEVVMDSFSLLFIPITARMFVQERYGEIRDVYWNSVLWITVFSFPLLAVSCSLASPLTVFLFGPQYAASAASMAILAVGFFFHAAAGLNTRTLKVYGKVRTVLAIDFCSAAFALGVNLLLIPWLGALGGAIALSATLILHNVVAEIVLSVATGISVFEWRYARLYGTVAAVAAALWLIQWLWSPPLYLGLVVAALASCLVLALNRRFLAVHETFPELLRVPLLGRWLLGAPRGEAAPV
jgi:O-antigen/teichoic acid export membrane protein